MAAADETIAKVGRAARSTQRKSAVTSIVPPAGLNLMAFDSRLVMHCRSLRVTAV